MSKNERQIRLNQAQVDYLKKKLATNNVQDAVDILVTIMVEERIEPTRLIVYVNKLMEKDGVKNETE